MMNRPSHHRPVRFGSALRRPGQSGMVLVSLLVVVLATVLLLLSGWSDAAAARAMAARAEQRRLVLERVSAHLTDWYRDHLAALDTPGAQVPGFPAMDLADLARLRLEPVLDGISVSDGVAGRTIRLLNSGGNRETGEVLVDGHGLERSAIAEAQEHLQRLAQALELWFRSRVVDDPLHRLDRDYFRPGDPACTAQEGELPCLPDYTEVGRIPFLDRMLHLDAADLQSPWGSCCPLQASTGPDASQRPPYSVALRVVTPWGRSLPMRAVEPEAGL